MGTPAPTVVTPGTVLAGKLRVERLIGQGAMGIVLEATDITLRRRVAVKLVHPDYVGDPEKRARFGREAYAVAGLQSQHVTKVLEISELDDGMPYFVMELLEGRTLDVVIERDGPAAIHVALDWILQALDAVAEAHAINLVHRDLKPANLYLAERRDRTPIVKVLDFGLVKDMSSDAAKLTALGATMGSPAYMAPEQVNVDQKVDSRTDVWAIGVTLFELLTRELPFEGRSIPALLHQVLEGHPTPLRARRPDAPPELEALIAKCLAKDPGARYADAAELSRALIPVRARLPQVTEATKTIRLPEGTVVPAGYSPMDMMDMSSVRPRIVHGDPTAMMPASPTPVPLAAGASSGRAMFVAAFVTTVLLCGLGFGAWFLLRDMTFPGGPPAEVVPQRAPEPLPPPLPSVAAAPPPSVEPAPSAPPSPSSVITSHATVTIELPSSLAEAQRRKWQSKARELGACGRRKASCAQVSLTRSADGNHTAVEGAPACTLSRAQKTCLETAVRKFDLPLSTDAAVRLTFR